MGTQRKGKGTPRNYWMLVVTPENLGITREHGFTVQGIRSKLRKGAERMEVGDRILYYLSATQRFAATATITSTYFEDHSALWKAESQSEDYPYRVHIEPAAVMEEAEFLDARQIGPRMESVKKWTPERWPLAFVGDIHLIPKNDFAFIEEEMKKIISARARRDDSEQPVQSATQQEGALPA